MAENIPIQAARIPDRDRLLAELRDAGLAAEPVGEVEIEVRLDNDSVEFAHDVYLRVEQMIMTLGAPFVPIKHAGVIYVRPPIG